jgi:hypothetical protein
MVNGPRPVELGAENLSVFVDILYTRVPSIVFAGFNNEDGHGGIFCQASCNSDAREATADDYIVKRLRSGIQWIPRYAVGTPLEDIRLGGRDKRSCAYESGGGDEAEVHRVQKEEVKERWKERMG